MNYENFGYGNLKDENQKAGSKFVVTWAYTYSSQGGKKGVVHKTTILIVSETLLMQDNDELLTKGTKAKPDIRYGNWELGHKMKIEAGGLLCLI